MEVDCTCDEASQQHNNAPRKSTHRDRDDDDEEDDDDYDDDDAVDVNADVVDDDDVGALGVQRCCRNFCCSDSLHDCLMRANQIQ